ncbi:MAG TPA: hypothetical protein VGQ86_06140 [Candidatus Limnocylindria bacterium]|nr:hypothetical protein [Candidatus Limnocylindria bacterium]
MSPFGPYVTWIIASVAAGGIVGVLLPCPSDVPKGVLVLAVTPAALLAIVVPRFGGSPARWLFATLVGVTLSFPATYVVFVFMALQLNALTPGQNFRPDTLVGALNLAAFTGTACFIGAAPLGVLQLFALPRERRSRTFVIAVMLGAASLYPIVLAIVGSFDCRDRLGPASFAGAAGGLVYGFATAAALHRTSARAA